VPNLSALFDSLRDHQSHRNISRVFSTSIEKNEEQAMYLARNDETYDRNDDDEFFLSYQVLLKLASTALPLPLLQMGCTFLFLWRTFSMPLVLQSPFGDTSESILFLFFLTYGFIGMELVGMQMMSPFGIYLP
jgi:hypothetical protein